jgi:hypothetical protein
LAQRGRIVAAQLAAFDVGQRGFRLLQETGRFAARGVGAESIEQSDRGAPCLVETGIVPSCSRSERPF